MRSHMRSHVCLPKRYPIATVLYITPHHIRRIYISISRLVCVCVYVETLHSLRSAICMDMEPLLKIYVILQMYGIDYSTHRSSRSM